MKSESGFSLAMASQPFMKDISCVRFEFVKRRQFRNNPPPRSTLGRAFSDRPEQFENSMRLRRECHRSDENIQILTSTTYSWYLLLPLKILKLIFPKYISFNANMIA